MSQNPDWKGIFGVGALIGAVVMGLLMTFVGEVPMREVNTAKEQCELNIPRNQNCVMQFIPELKK